MISHFFGNFGKNHICCPLPLRVSASLRKILDPPLVSSMATVVLLPPPRGKVIFLHLSVILFTGVPGQVHPPGPSTPPSTRYPLGPGTPPGPGTTPRNSKPRDQVHPLGTRYTPWEDVHTTQDQVHPRDQVHPLGPSTPRTRDTPQDQVHPTPPSSACWEIRATSGRYASYWNAFLSRSIFVLMHYNNECFQNILNKFQTILNKLEDGH